MHRHNNVLLIVLVTGVMALSSCTATAGDVDSPSLPAMWASQFTQALADPNLSSFTRQALSDYVVTTAEYQESFQRFGQCLANIGYSLVGEPEGYSITPPDTGPIADQLKTSQKQVLTIGTCDGPDSDSGWITISLIYQGMQNNPQGLTNDQLIRECYESHGVPDGVGMTDDQFSQMLQDPTYIPSTGEAVLCKWDPTGVMGWTVDQAERMQAQATSAAS